MTEKYEIDRTEDFTPQGILQDFVNRDPYEITKEVFLTEHSMLAEAIARYVQLKENTSQYLEKAEIDLMLGKDRLEIIFFLEPNGRSVLVSIPLYTEYLKEEDICFVIDNDQYPTLKDMTNGSFHDFIIKLQQEIIPNIMLEKRFKEEFQNPLHNIVSFAENNYLRSTTYTNDKNKVCKNPFLTEGFKEEMLLTLENLGFAMAKYCCEEGYSSRKYTDGDTEIYLQFCQNHIIIQYEDENLAEKIVTIPLTYSINRRMGNLGVTELYPFQSWFIFTDFTKSDISSILDVISDLQKIVIPSILKGTEFSNQIGNFFSYTNN